MRGSGDDLGEPLSWLLVFHRSAKTKLANRLVPGRFKHVSAFGYCAGVGTWVFFDPALDRTHVAAFSDESGPAAYARHAAGNSVLRMPVLGDHGGLYSGFWCVSAIKRLVGLRTGALLPATLWRDCLANGAEIVSDGNVITAA